MDNFSEFEDKIMHKLSQLETSRRVRYSIYFISHLLYFVPLYTYYFFVKDRNLGDFPILILLIVTISLAIAIFLFIAFQSKSYEHKFKSLILAEFLDTLYPDIHYDKERKIERDTFKESKLFIDDFSGYYGEDYFEGTTADKLKFQFSELDISYEQYKNKFQTLFEGLFIVIDTPEFNFPGLFIISKDGSFSFSTTNPFIREFKSMSIARLNPHLDTLCTFHGKDHEMNHNMINSEFSERLIDMTKSWSKSFRISFYKNRVYIALDKIDNLFHTSISTTINSDFLITQIRNDLEKCFGLVNNFSQLISKIDNSSQDKIIKEDKPKEKPIDSSLYDHLIGDV